MLFEIVEQRVVAAQEEVEQILPVRVAAHMSQVIRGCQDVLSGKQVATIDLFTLDATAHFPCTRISSPGWNTMPMPSVPLAIFDERKENRFQLTQVRFTWCRERAFEKVVQVHSLRSRHARQEQILNQERVERFAVGFLRRVRLPNVLVVEASKVGFCFFPGT